jgi:hypothetical protein
MKIRLLVVMILWHEMMTCVLPLQTPTRSIVDKYVLLVQFNKWQENTIDKQVYFRVATNPNGNETINNDGRLTNWNSMLTMYLTTTMNSILRMMLLNYDDSIYLLNFFSLEYHMWWMTFFVLCLKMSSTFSCFLWVIAMAHWYIVKNKMKMVSRSINLSLNIFRTWADGWIRSTKRNGLTLHLFILLSFILTVTWLLIFVAFVIR